MHIFACICVALYLLDFTIRLENIFYLEANTMREHYSHSLIIYH